MGAPGRLGSQGGEPDPEPLGRVLGGDGRGTLRGSVAVAERKSGFAFGVLDRERTDRGTVARLDGDLALGARSRIRAGLEGADLVARQRGSLPTSDRLAPGSPAEWADEREFASHLGGYAETEISPVRDLAVVTGVRADRLPGEDRWTVDPRLALALQLDRWTVRVGGGVFHQGRWRTRYALPDSLSPAGTPRRATHLVAGAERQGEPAIRVEGYLKSYDEYLEAGPGAADHGRARSGRGRDRALVAPGAAEWLAHLLAAAGPRGARGWAIRALGRGCDAQPDGSGALQARRVAGGGLHGAYCHRPAVHPLRW